MMNEDNDYDKKHQETFCHKFAMADVLDGYKIEVPVDVPFEGNIKELAYRIINGFNLPLYFIEGNNYDEILLQKYHIDCPVYFTELCDELQTFIDKCTVEFYDRQTIDAIDSVKNETIEIEDVVKYWEKAFKEVNILS